MYKLLVNFPGKAPGHNVCAKNLTQKRRKKRDSVERKGRVKPEVIWTVRNSGEKKTILAKKSTGLGKTSLFWHTLAYVCLARIFLTPNMCQSEAGTRECIFSRAQKPRNLPLSYAHGKRNIPLAAFPQIQKRILSKHSRIFVICVCVLTVCSHSEKGSIEAVKSHCSQDNNSFFPARLPNERTHVPFPPK